MAGHPWLWVEVWHPVQHWFYSSWWGQDVLAGGILSVWAIVYSHIKSAKALAKHLEGLHGKLDHVIRHHPDIPPYAKP